MRMRPPPGGEILRSKISSPRAQKEFDMQVVYEDNQIIVVIKPQNQPSQKDESGDLDLLSEVKEYVKQKYNKPGEAFIGLVHRLDRPTGGLMVLQETLSQPSAFQNNCNLIKCKRFILQWLRAK